MKRNDLLAEEISQTIDRARYVEPKPEKTRRPLFYIIILCLVTLAVLLSLFR